MVKERLTSFEPGFYIASAASEINLSSPKAVDSATKQDEHLKRGKLIRDRLTENGYEKGTELHFPPTYTFRKGLTGVLNEYIYANACYSILNSPDRGSIAASVLAHIAGIDISDILAGENQTEE